MKETNQPHKNLFVLFGIPATILVLTFFISTSHIVFADASTTMLGYWKLDETNSGTCTSGDDSCDSSGNGNDGSWVGNPTHSASKPTLDFSTNGSLYFNGSSSYTNYGNVSSLNFGTSDFSISFWMDPSAWGNGSSQGVIDKKMNDSTNGWTIYNDTGQESKIDARLGQQNQFFSNSNVPNNQWSNWVFERSGTNIYWYFNGTLDASGTNNVSLSDSAPLEIGHSQTWNGYFHGNIANVRIFPYALSQSDITNIAAGEDVGVNQPSTPQQTVNVNENSNVSFDVLNIVSSFADASTLSITSNPTHGIATDPEGYISYTPTQGYVGDDSIEYQICSIVDNGVCSTGTLYFDVEAAVIAATSSNSKSDPETGYGQPVNYTSIDILLSGSSGLIIVGTTILLRQNLRRSYILSNH